MHRNSVQKRGRGCGERDALETGAGEHQAPAGTGDQAPEQSPGEVECCLWSSWRTLGKGQNWINGVGDPSFPTSAGKWGGMFCPGCQEKQDTLQEQNSELIFISVGPEGTC